MKNERKKESARFSDYTSIAANLLIAVLLLLSGALMEFVNGMRFTVFSYVAGGFLIAWGVLLLVKYFAKKEYLFLSNYDFALGTLILVPGVLVIIRADTVSAHFPLLFGVLMLCEGAVALQHTVQMKQFGSMLWTLEIIIAAGLIALSVCTILDTGDYCAKEPEVFYAVLMGAGIAGILSQILVAIRSGIYRKEQKKETIRNMEAAEEFDLSSGGRAAESSDKPAAHQGEVQHTGSEEGLHDTHRAASGDSGKDTDDAAEDDVPSSVTESAQPGDSVTETVEKKEAGTEVKEEH